MKTIENKILVMAGADSKTTIQKPFTLQFFLAKMKIFFELFENKNAVDQSLDLVSKLSRLCPDTDKNQINHNRSC